MFADDTLGTGTAAKAGNLISFHFDAWIIKDSTNLFTDWKIDSTRQSSNIGGSRIVDMPLKLVLGAGQFIPGSDEGIEGMKIGGYRTIIIPSNLCYGEKGMGPIPPNSSLKLQVQLLDVKEPVVTKKWDVDPSKFKTTKDSLKYAVIEPGEGAAIDSGDVVSLHYSGYLLDGSKFDSSVERDEPLELQYKVQPIIKGFNEGISFLKQGGKAQLIIPPYLAYGARGTGKTPANATLIFDIEILKVQKLGGK